MIMWTGLISDKRGKIKFVPDKLRCMTQNAKYIKKKIIIFTNKTLINCTIVPMQYDNEGIKPVKNNKKVTS